MHIYVDESGSFVIPAAGVHRIVGVVGIVVPSGQKAALFRKFRDLKKGWPGAAGGVEVKGSSLSEREVAQAIGLLASFDVIAEAVLTDMGVYTATALRAFQVKQADKLIEHITPQHSPKVVAETTQLRDELLALPLQLFVQVILMIQLLSSVLQTATIYHAFRFPPELGQFDWVIDAKDKAITTMEKLWSSLLLPILQTQGFTEPFIQVIEGNYRAFERFEVSESDASPKLRPHLEWLKSMTPKAQGTEYTGIDHGKIFERLEFHNSEDEFGLQLADIVASALCRAFNGTLRVDGWKDLGSLFVKRSLDAGGSIRMIKLDSNAAGGEVLQPRHAAVRRAIDESTLAMFRDQDPVPPGVPFPSGPRRT
jgi:hypothetical protein